MACRPCTIPRFRWTNPCKSVRSNRRRVSLESLSPAIPNASFPYVRIKMRMDAQIQRLVHLQALDTRLAELRNRLQAIPAQLSAVDARVSNTRQQIAAAKEALTTSL